MDLQGERTGTFAVTQTFHVSHEVDVVGAKRWREEQVHYHMMRGIAQILSDGRCYEIQVTTTTVCGGQYPPGVQSDGAPSLAHPQGIPLDYIHSQYTITCRAIIVLADPRKAGVGERVSIDAFAQARDQDYRMNLFRDDEPDWVFERVKVGWKRIR